MRTSLITSPIFVNFKHDLLITILNFLFFVMFKKCQFTLLMLLLVTKTLNNKIKYLESLVPVVNIMKSPFSESQKPNNPWALIKTLGFCQRCLHPCY